MSEKKETKLEVFRDTEMGLGNVLPIVPSGICENPTQAVLVVAFLKRLPETIERLKSSVERRDWKGARIRLGDLTNAKLYGYQSISAPLSQLELAVERCDLEKAQDLIPQIELAARGMEAGRASVEQIVQEIPGFLGR